MTNDEILMIDDVLKMVDATSATDFETGFLSELGMTVEDEESAFNAANIILSDRAKNRTNPSPYLTRLNKLAQFRGYTLESLSTKRDEPVVIRVFGGSV